MMKFWSGVLVAMVLTGPVMAATPGDRASMRRLAEQRDQLHRQMDDLDRLAAVRVVAGERPLDLHARQLEIERQLERVTHRIEMLAAESGLPAPALGTAHELAAEQRAETQARAEALLDRGRERAVVVVQVETQAFLADLDFTEFLSDD
ncbi:MAG: hypothetical protein RIG82_10760 [Phycisphaeraceae bacterium]